MRLVPQQAEERGQRASPRIGVGRGQSPQDRPGYSERGENPRVHVGPQARGGKGHVPCVKIHPAVLGRQRHEVRVAGAPGAAFQPEPAPRDRKLLRREGIGAPALELRYRGQREVHQAGAAVLHLTRRHGRRRERIPAGGDGARFLGQGRAHIETDRDRQDETECQGRACPGRPGSRIHLANTPVQSPQRSGPGPGRAQKPYRGRRFASIAGSSGA